MDKPKLFSLIRAGSKRDLTLLCLTYFLVDLSVQACSLGATVGAALQKHGLQSTAWVVAVSTCGSLAAFIIQKLEFHCLEGRSSNLFLSFVSAALSFGLGFTPFAALIWFVLIFSKVTVGTLLPARIMATSRNYSSASPVHINKWLQFASTGAFLLSLALGPILISELNFRGLFIMDAVLMTLASGLFAIVHRYFNEYCDDEVASGIHKNTTQFSALDKSDFALILLTTFIVYSVTGLFHVFEVPFLREKLGASSQEIGFIFFITGLSNLLSIPGMSETLLKEKWKQLFVSSSVLLLVTSVLYIWSTSIIQALVVVCIIGVANSVLMLSKTSRIQLLEDERDRSKLYTLCRLASSAGLLVSATSFRWIPTLTELNRPFVFMSAAGVTTIIIVSAFARMITIRSTTRFASFVLLAVLIHTNGYAAELRVAVPAFLESSDPAKAFDASSALILGQIFEPLYVYSESNTLRPNLAVSHTISPDGKSIYVTLNPSAKFSDGSTLNAKDVVRSFEHTAAVLKREISWAMGDLEGFEEYINEPNVAKTISGIKVIADNKIEFRLKRPFPQFLQTLTVEGFAISKQSSSGLIGTGAYILASKDAHSIILKRRPDLDTDERMPTSIRFTLIPKKQNYVEFANVEKIDIGEIHDHPVSLPAGYHVERIEYLQTVVLLMNQRNAAFSTPEKRCNFSRSIEAVFQEGKYALRPLSLGIPFTWDTYSEVNKRKGVSPDKVSVTINFADSVGEFKDQLNREISHQLYKTGNSVKFQRTDLRKLVKLLRSSQFDGVLLGYVPDYFDLDALLTPFLKTGQQYNFMGYSNDEVDRLLTLARTVSDKAARLQIYKEVMSVVQHDCPIAFLGSQDSSVLVSDRWDLPKLSSLGFHKIRFKDVHYRGGN